ncbi:MAG: ATP-binding protein [Cytobacillus gottheilii]|uniref:ATP-binding protein n=1 Tax=Cytobacillus gottheilii TaxID=859144 RepID=UPI0009EE09E2|nr:ATP-binding protein [Cytobacillus gottheilii]
MKDNKWISKLSLKKLTILLVLISVLASLVSSALFLHYYITDREREVLTEEIRNITRVVAKDTRVINGLTEPSSDSDIQRYASQIVEDTDLSFVVVLDNDLIRYSHPDEDYIGKQFSNTEDASKALNGKEHFSRNVGILGEGTRFFTPILNEDGEQIGVVCAGIIQENVNQELWDAQKRLYFGLSIGLCVGLIGAIYLAQQLKNILLGLEPREIVANIMERDIIIDSVNEGIIAVTPEGKVLLSNKNFIKLMKLAEFSGDSIGGGELDPDIFEVFFKKVFESGQPVLNQVIVVNQFEFIVNISQVYIKDSVYGAVATLRDQSEMQQLIRELSGTEQYIDSLRAQNHKFMNQLHTILGLIELRKYEDVTRFIQILDADYHREIGFVTEKIKCAAIAGFLLGKVSELKEQGVNLQIDPDCLFADMKMGEMLHDLLLSIGVLIDNAKEAVIDSKNKQVNFFLRYNEDENVIIIEVQDTGVGISEELMDLIFERGFSTKGGSRGYGLDAVRSIVKQYNGIVDLQSIVDVGTVFRLEVPYDRKGRGQE